MAKTSGLLFFIAGILLVLGIMVAEIYYPVPYSISQNFISNLGATPPPNSVSYQPSAGIFDLALLISGLLTIIGAIMLKRVVKKNLVIIPLLLMGIGAAGVGLFPAKHIVPHLIFAFLAFTAGGVAAILSSKVTKSPFSLVSIILGATTLCFLITGQLFPDTLVPILGKGGTERLVAYPAILWLIGFGGYLLG